MFDSFDHIARMLPATTSSVLLDVLVKATALLIAAVILDRFLRKASAALRHRMWCLTFVGLLALPLLAATLPAWRIPILPQVAESSAEPNVQETNSNASVIQAPRESSDAVELVPVEPKAFAKSPARVITADIRPQAQDSVPAALEQDLSPTIAPASLSQPEVASAPVPWALIAVSVWCLGTLFTIWPLLPGFMRINYLRRASQKVDLTEEASWLQALSARLGLNRNVRLFETARSIVPVTWGVLWPVVLVPKSWREWSPERRELVLLHELAHVKRFDVGYQIIARLSCAFYWFHPLAWYGLRKLRIERELACDDCVLSTGAQPTAYARELVDMAKQYQLLSLPTTVAMAHTTKLEERVRCLLDRARSRGPLGRVRASLLLGVATLLVTAVAMVEPAASQPPAEAGTAVAAGEVNDADPNQEDNVTFRFKGRVLNPGGQPVANAKLWFTYWKHGWPSETEQKPVATTNADGDFDFNVRRSPSFGEKFLPTLVATGDGFGFGDVWSGLFETTGHYRKAQTADVRKSIEKRLEKHDGTIRLVRDLPLEGRIMNTEGNPVPNVQVRVDRLWFNKEQSLDEWETAARKPNADFYSIREHTEEVLNGPQLTSVLPPVTTGADGRFTFRGLGAERVVKLFIRGGGVESSPLMVRTRAGKGIELPTIRSYTPRMGQKRPKDIYHPAQFAHVAGPSIPIVGRVTDAETGAPIAGAFLTAGMNTTFSGGGKDYIWTYTDKEGNYRLEGLARGSRDDIYVSGPMSSAYVPGGVRISVKGDDPEIRSDIKLRKGVWVRGTIVDDRTGKPLTGPVQYFAVPSDDLKANFPLFRFARTYERRSDKNGRFAIAVPPGSGILATTPDKHQDYKRGLGAETLTAPNSGGMFLTQPSPLLPNNFAAAVNVDVDAKADTRDVTIALTSGSTITGKVIDPDGRTLTKGVMLKDDSPLPAHFNERKGRFEVDGYYEDKSREVFFIHVERNLAAARTLEGKVKQPLSVQLKPAGTVRGRLLDKDGDPMSGLMLVGKGLPSGPYGLQRNITDDDGRFEIRGLIPGRKYTVRVRNNNSTTFARALVDFSIDSATTKDVGDVTITSGSSDAQASSSSNPGQKKAAKDVGMTVRGQVLTAGGKPVPGAKLWLPTMKKNAWRPRDLGVREVGRTDASGAFEFRIDKDAYLPEARQHAFMATADGFGLGWVDLKTKGTDKTALKITLPGDTPIRGRLLTTEGQPVKNMAIRVGWVATADSDKIPEFLTAYRSEWESSLRAFPTRLWVPAHQLAKVTINKDGTFEVRGLGANRVVSMEFTGDDIATATQWVVTKPGVNAEAVHKEVVDRMPAELRMPGNPHPLVSANFTQVAEAAHTIFGTVTDADTNEPLSGVRVGSITGWDAGPNAVTDAKGRYELTGLPQLDEYLSNAYLPDGEFLPRHFMVESNAATRRAQHDFQLRKGIRLSGRVVDKQTGEGVRGSVRFVPLPTNKYIDVPGYDDYKHSHVMEGTEDDGTYSILVMPGPGVVMAQVSQPEKRFGDRPVKIYRTHQLSKADRERVHPKGEDQYFATADGNGIDFLQEANRILETTPETGAVKGFDLFLERGEQREIRVVDTSNKPLNDVFVSGLTDQWPIAFRVPESQTRIYAIDPASPRSLHLLHPEKKLGAFVELTGEADEPTDVQLQPLATLTGTAVDEAGTPISNAHISLAIAHKSAKELYRELRRLNAPITTDDDGRFLIENVIPGMKFRVYFRQGRDDRYRIEKRFTLKAGANRDLSTVTLKKL